MYHFDVAQLRRHRRCGDRERIVRFGFVCHLHGKPSLLVPHERVTQRKAAADLNGRLEVGMEPFILGMQLCANAHRRSAPLDVTVLLLGPEYCPLQIQRRSA